MSSIKHSLCFSLMIFASSILTSCTIAKLTNQQPEITRVTKPASQSADSTQTKQTPLSEPEKAVSAFYQGYLQCLENHFANMEGNSIDEDCPLSDNPFLTHSASGNILCAQNTPQRISAKQLEISQDSATVQVTEYWGAQDPTYLKVNLKLVDNTWKIDTITCN